MEVSVWSVSGPVLILEVPFANAMKMISWSCSVGEQVSRAISSCWCESTEYLKVFVSATSKAKISEDALRRFFSYFFSRLALSDHRSRRNKHEWMQEGYPLSKRRSTKNASRGRGSSDNESCSVAYCSLFGFHDNFFFYLHSLVLCTYSTVCGHVE